MIDDDDNNNEELEDKVGSMLMKICCSESTGGVGYGKI
jgi:hypothetical protein